MPSARYPSLLEVNTRVRLSERASELGRPATLDDLPDDELDRWTADGFDLVWLLGVWQTGETARRVARSNPGWLAEYRRVLPDFRGSDVSGSPFAVCDYRVHEDFGGNEALARFRHRLRDRGLRLILDFVPNHIGLDHSWVKDHPDYIVAGTEERLAAEPQNYVRASSDRGSRILAHGRDPHFDGWSDTYQLNYGNPALQDAMLGELLRIARQCDGVRCDMAMLVLPEVFERTWGIPSRPFWPRATSAVGRQVPGFLFLAEVYWDLEWTLQQQGFDYTYDKGLYDRLRQGHARTVRDHLRTALDYQKKLARFLENHDEPRAAAMFAPQVHQAAAVVTFLSPGLRFFHRGQLQGRKKRIPLQLCRGPLEPTDQKLAQFYDRLLAILRQPLVRDGEWRLLECLPAWEGNWTWECFLAFAWQHAGGERLVVAVNYAPNQSQCYVRLPFEDLAGRQWRLRDHLEDLAYDRDGSDLQCRGLYLDVSPWKASVLALTSAP